jgi:hypothetical protein
MVRFLAGVASALSLVAAGLFWWRGSGDPPRLPIMAGAASAAETDPLPGPPAASEKTREEKRFSRYEKDKDGAVSREEYSVKAIAKFATPDADHSNRLTRPNLRPPAWCARASPASIVPRRRVRKLATIMTVEPIRPSLAATPSSRSYPAHPRPSCR